MCGSRNESSPMGWIFFTIIQWDGWEILLGQSWLSTIATPKITMIEKTEFHVALEPPLNLVLVVTVSVIIQILPSVLMGRYSYICVCKKSVLYMIICTMILTSDTVIHKQNVYSSQNSCYDTSTISYCYHIYIYHYYYCIYWYCILL